MREQVNLSKAMTQKAFGAFGETLLLRVPARVYGVDRHHFSCFGVDGVDAIALAGSKT